MTQLRTIDKTDLCSSNNTLVRAFVALPLTLKEKSKVKKLVKKIQQYPEGKNIQWVLEGNLHITLQFLGKMTRSKGKTLMKGIKKYLDFEQLFMLETKKLIVLPSRINPKVLALTIKKTKPLMQLAALVYQLGAGLNIKLSTRAYLPHLTLGYLKVSDNFLNLTELVVETITLYPKEIVLFESKAETTLKYMSIQSITL